MQNSVRSFIEYLEVERHYSPNTLRSYESDLHHFVAFLLANHVRSLDAVTKNLLRAYLSTLLDEGLTKKSIARKIASLRSFFRFGKRKKLVSTNPTLTIVSPKLEKRLPSYLDESSTKQLFDAVETDTPLGRRNAAILELFYSTGIRLSELIGLNIGDVDMVQAIVKVTGKGSKQRIVPVGRRAMQAMRSYLADRDAAVARKGGQDQPALFLTTFFQNLKYS